jgi:hypothetical protein
MTVLNVWRFGMMCPKIPRRPGVQGCPETPQSNGKQYHAHNETFSLVLTEQIAPTGAVDAGLNAAMGVTWATPPFAQPMNGKSGAAMMLLNVLMLRVRPVLKRHMGVF